MSEYNNGHVIDTSEILNKDFEKAAKEWAEGNKALEELLNYCLKNNIITQACCAGHKDGDSSYIQFELSEKNKNAIIKIIYQLYDFDEITMIFLNQPGIISKFALDIPKSKSDIFFKKVLLAVSDNKDIGIDSLPDDMKSTLNAMMGHKVPEEYLEVQYSVSNKRRDGFVATTNPNYSDLYWDKPQTISWVDESIGIEGSPSEIQPIIEDINKKTHLEYLKYMDNQKMKDLKPKPKTKTEISPIVGNVQATRENDYARMHRMIICDVLPGMSLEDVAKAVCGKNYICKFNDFEINGMKFKKTEQIIEAYDRYCEEKRQRKIDAKSATKTALSDTSTDKISVNEAAIETSEFARGDRAPNGGAVLE